MNTCNQKQIHSNTIFFYIFLFAIATSVMLNACNRPAVAKHNGEKDIISFKQIQGIHFIEIARVQKNGLSFSNNGYRLIPQWDLNFVSDDSISIYSPVKKSFINFPLTRGYDSIFNAARSWLKVKKINRDSIVLEMLKANGDSVETTGTRVYMKFYSTQFVNRIHGNVSQLRQATPKDSLFIRTLADKANIDYTKAFAAQQPAEIITKSPFVQIVKRQIKADLLANNFDASDNYMVPTFDIIINNAYKNFYYSFSVYADIKGQMHYRMPLIDFRLSHDFEPTYIRLSTGIMNGYLKRYTKIKNGETLGLPHASILSVHVRGIKSRRIKSLSNYINAD